MEKKHEQEAKELEVKISLEAKKAEEEGRIAAEKIRK